ncbi:MAG: hypothetical protein AB1726_12205 [Planctomycetota bacterium]
MGNLYHRDGINRFLSYYGIEDVRQLTERAVMIRAKTPILYDGSLMVSISAIFTSMESSPVMPRIRAIAIGAPGGGAPQVPAGQEIWYTKWDSNYVWLELVGGFGPGYTILLMEPGDGTDCSGTRVMLEGAYEAAVPSFSAFPGAGNGWVSRSEAAPELPVAEAERGDEGYHFPERTVSGALPREEARGNPEAAAPGFRSITPEDSGQDCPLPPPGPSPETCEPSPGWLSSFFLGYEKTGTTACQTYSQFNNNKICFEVGPDDPPPSHKIRHTKGHKITIGGKLGQKDGAALTPSYEYTTEEEDEVNLPFGAGAHGLGQCKGSYTQVTVCVATWRRKVPTYEYMPPEPGERWGVRASGWEWSYSTYSCEEEYVSWVTCDRTPSE